ncbi:MAG: hypothetical protein KDD41_12465 [Flavobacteriales bacterium]|nr:hypothetical protein [Flavobacteriales bacterium]
MEKTDIKIGIGLSDIRFGMTKNELTSVAGEPEEKDLYQALDDEDEDDDNYLSESWHYDEDEYSVAFDEEDGWRVTTISTSNPNASLFGKKLIGKSLNDVADFLANQDLGEGEIEEMDEENSKLSVLSFLASSLNLWFTNGRLTEIQWGVLWKDEDTPDWP